MRFPLYEIDFAEVQPHVPECLYFHASEKTVRVKDGRLILDTKKLYSNTTISFDTFFGAFPIEPWLELTDVENIFLEIKGTGILELSLYADNGIEPAQKIIDNDIKISNDEFLLKINLKNLPFKRGIIYPKITVKSSDFQLEYLRYSTDKQPINDVKLAIIMPTYRREKYIERNISLLKDRILFNSYYNVKLFVIDNGKSLKPISCDKVEIIPNKNLGGAGGFARGVIEVLDSDFTHILFSDDDIEFNVESIKRLINFYRYSKEIVAIGGGMFNLNYKNILNEQGGYLHYLKIYLSKHNKNMCDSKNVIDYTYQEETNYYGWWFFSVPKCVFKDYGLPLPIFFRGDDQEFGMRIKNKVKFLSLLGVGVWHEEFYKKDMPVTDYYIIRNNLIVSMLHEPKSSRLLINLAKRLLIALLTYRYERAKFIIKGMEDFLKGPSFIENLKADEYHLSLMRSQEKKLEDKRDKFVSSKYNSFVRNNIFRKILIFLTLNGHILPSFLIKKGDSPYDEGYVIEPLHSNRLDVLFRKETALYYEPTTGKGIEYKIDRKQFFSLLFKGLKNLFLIMINYNKLQRAYKNSFNIITSERFWKKILK